MSLTLIDIWNWLINFNLLWIFFWLPIIPPMIWVFFDPPSNANGGRFNLIVIPLVYYTIMSFIFDVGLGWFDMFTLFDFKDILIEVFTEGT